jgi:hypothetical protein
MQLSVPIFPNPEPLAGREHDHIRPIKSLWVNTP